MPRVKPTTSTAVPTQSVVSPINPTPPAVPAVEEKVKKVVVKRKKPVQTEIQENLEVVASPPTPLTPPTPATPPTLTDVPPEVEEPPAVAEDDSKTEKKRTRRQVTKESFYNDFETFFKLCETDLAEKKGLLKQLKQLKSDGFKLLKIKNMGDDKKNKGDNNSGFMKPVRVSDDLASFIGVNTDEPITRVLITKKICQHIKDKDLQNPEDRREILPDLALRKLFNITDNDTEPLTYYGIQKRIQRHIFKLNADTSA